MQCVNIILKKNWNILLLIGSFLINIPPNHPSLAATKRAWTRHHSRLCRDWPCKKEQFQALESSVSGVLAGKTTERTLTFLLPRPRAASPTTQSAVARTSKGSGAKLFKKQRAVWVLFGETPCLICRESQCLKGFCFPRSCNVKNWNQIFIYKNLIYLFFFNIWTIYKKDSYYF